MALLTALALLAAPVFPNPKDDKPPTLAEIRRAVDASIDFLLSTQESYVTDSRVGTLPDDQLAEWQDDERKRLSELRGAKGAAEWPYEGVYRVGGAIPSGYRVGGTSIVCDTLLRSGATDQRAERIGAAVERSLDFIIDMIQNDEGMSIGPKKGYDVRGWGHTCALQLLLTLHEQQSRDEDGQDPRVATMIPILIDRIAANQTAMGGWNYANDRSVSPFMTGSTLLTLYEARARGFDVDAEMVQRALDALEASRTEAVSYAYSGKVRGEVPMPGSSARAACAELALYRAGRSSVDALRQAVVGFFEGYEDLLVRKSKQKTHEPPYGIAPYYFYFGHTYAALAIEELPEAERGTHRAELARLIWSTRDDDGSWNDRVFPRTASYSTAMVVLSLQAADRRRSSVWKAAGPAGKR